MLGINYKLDNMVAPPVVTGLTLTAELSEAAKQAEGDVGRNSNGPTSVRKQPPGGAEAAVATIATGEQHHRTAAEDCG